MDRERRLVISMPHRDGSWTNAMNMGSRVPSVESERFPHGSSSAGPYLLFAGDRNGNFENYSMDAKIINELGSNNLRDAIPGGLDA